jgi:hypothetical protein
MILYNNKNGVFLFIIVFILWSIKIGKACPCKTPSENICVREEFYGVQYNHLILFIIIGMIFPSYFYTFMILGILWEIYEFILDKKEDWVYNYIGGCLSEKPINFKHENHISDAYIFKGDIKYLNPIDRFFNIKNSTNHMWHGSVAELIPNLIGFGIGYSINRLLQIYSFN